MWPFLPKECNCTETPNNPGTSCNHSGLTASDLIYEGIAGECSGITPGMTASEILQQLSYFLCSIELTQYILDLIQENPEEYPEFIELVNGAINCETIYACGPVPTTTTTTTVEPTTTTTTSSSTSTTTTSSSSTTTTTTTVLDACVTYTLQALVNNASWIATTCAFARTGGIIPLAGGIITTPCIINNTLVLTQAVIVTETECTTTTTTTAAPTTTTTSTTIAPTTTTTSSTTEFIGCASYGLEAKTEDSILFFYNACLGRSDIPIIVPGNTTVIVCANGSPTTTAPPYKGEVSFEGPC